MLIRETPIKKSLLRGQRPYQHNPSCHPIRRETLTPTEKRLMGTVLRFPPQVQRRRDSLWLAGLLVAACFGIAAGLAWAARVGGW